MSVTIDGTGTVTGLSTGGLPDGSIAAADLATDAVTGAKIADDAITLAKMASGTDGNIISYDASGNPVAIATGSDGQVLTSTGAGSPPAFEAASSGLYASVAMIADQKAHDVHGGTFTQGAWRTRDLNTEISDVDGIVSISSNQFTLQAGTYTIEYQSVFMETNGTATRLYNITDSSIVSIGMILYVSASDSTGGTPPGMAVVTISGAKVFEIQSSCNTSQVNYGYGHSASLGSDSPTIYTLVKILKHS